MRQVSDEVRKVIKEELRKGNIVILHPAATKKFRGAKVKTVDYPG